MKRVLDWFVLRKIPHVTKVPQKFCRWFSTICFQFLCYSFQVEGGFVQGLGLFTIEEIRYSQTGTPWTTGPGAYKIPGFADIPVEFYVHLLRSAPNEKAVFSSKVRRIFIDVKTLPFRFIVYHFNRPKSVWIIILLRLGPFRREIGLSQLSEVFSPGTFLKPHIFYPNNSCERGLKPSADLWKKWCGFGVRIHWYLLNERLILVKKKLVWLVWMVPYSVEKVLLNPRSD